MDDLVNWNIFKQINKLSCLPSISLASLSITGHRLVGRASRCNRLISYLNLCPLFQLQLRDIRRNQKSNYLMRFFINNRLGMEVLDMGEIVVWNSRRKIMLLSC